MGSGRRYAGNEVDVYKRQIVRDEMLDLFYDFIQDETHSILFSSHITTDIEKIADTVTFIHQGRLQFSLPKDVLHDEYGIVKGSRCLLYTSRCV